MQNCKKITSLIIVDSKLVPNPKHAENVELIELYQSYIGIQMWAYICTRPDLKF